MKRDPAFRWLIISLIHAIIAMFVSWLILFRKLEKFILLEKIGFSSFQASILVGIAVYLLFWWVYPLRFYRRMFSSMLGILAIATISITFGIFSDKFSLFLKLLQGHPVLYICWTVIMLALLILDFKSRNPQHESNYKTYRSGGFSLSLFLRNRITIILLLIFAVAVVLFGPG